MIKDTSVPNKPSSHSQVGAINHRPHKLRAMFAEKTKEPEAMGAGFANYFLFCFHVHDKMSSCEATAQAWAFSVYAFQLVWLKINARKTRKDLN